MLVFKIKIKVIVDVRRIDDTGFNHKYVWSF